MQILVAGATGKAGLQLVRELKANGHSPIALVNSTSDISALPSGVALRQGDLTDLQEGVCDGCDAVIFAARSGGSAGPKTERVNDFSARGGINLVCWPDWY